MNVKIALYLHIVIPTSHFPQVIKKKITQVCYLDINLSIFKLFEFLLTNSFQTLEAYKIPSLQK